MYTVVRFSSCALDKGPLADVRRGLVLQYGDSLSSEKRGHFSCSLCLAESWKEHEQSIVAFLDTFSDLIAEASRKNLSVQFDTMIEPEDFKKEGIFELWFSEATLAKLATGNVTAGFSIYVNDALVWRDHGKQ